MSDTHRAWVPHQVTCFTAVTHPVAAGLTVVAVRQCRRARLVVRAARGAERLTGAPRARDRAAVRAVRSSGTARDIARARVRARDVPARAGAAETLDIATALIAREVLAGAWCRAGDRAICVAARHAVARARGQAGDRARDGVVAADRAARVSRGARDVALESGRADRGLRAVTDDRAAIRGAREVAGLTLRRTQRWRIRRRRRVDHAVARHADPTGPALALARALEVVAALVDEARSGERRVADRRDEDTPDCQTLFHASR